jgi:hypothetical protein
MIQTKKPPKLKVRQDAYKKEMTIEGVKYRFDYFQLLAGTGDYKEKNECYKIIKREDGIISIAVYDLSKYRLKNKYEMFLTSFGKRFKRLFRKHQVDKETAEAGKAC